VRLALAQIDVESGAVERNRRRALDAIAGNVRSVSETSLFTPAEEVTGT